MRIFRAAAARLTEPREGSGSVMRFDCPFCDGIFRTAEAAAKHTEACKGE
jgi:uncharacterized C2H2 Zn-finger protein